MSKTGYVKRTTFKSSSTKITDRAMEARKKLVAEPEFRLFDRLPGAVRNRINDADRFITRAELMKVYEEYTLFGGKNELRALMAIERILKK